MTRNMDNKLVIRDCKKKNTQFASIWKIKWSIVKYIILIGYIWSKVKVINYWHVVETNLRIVGKNEPAFLHVAQTSCHLAVML